VAWAAGLAFCELQAGTAINSDSETGRAKAEAEGMRIRERLHSFAAVAI
jgi:hypothetical protein